MSSKAIIGIVVIIIVLIAIFAWAGGNDTTNVTVMPGNETSTTGAPVATSSVTPNTPAQDSVKTFTVSGENFSFAPNQLRVQQGDTVRITFRNIEGKHDLRIDEMNVATKVLDGGQEETVEFVASRAGSFEYYCSVGTHRQMGMVGTLVVE